MLIKCHRHTSADLEMWKKYQQIDAINASKDRLQQLTDKSIGWLQQFYNKNKGNSYIGVSWGKDSVVLSHLNSQSGNLYPIVHIRQIPGINEYHDAVRDVFLDSYKPVYYEYICDYGDIDAKYRTEDELIKACNPIFYRTIRKIEKEIGSKHITGIRGQESSGRNIRMKRWGVETNNALAPIGWWKTGDIFAYLCKYDLPIHPNYAMLGDGRWPREQIRVDAIGGGEGIAFGRLQWEREYYGDVLNRLSI